MSSGVAGAGFLRAGLLAVLALCAAALPARAQIGSDRYAAIVVDARNGEVLFAANADDRRHPASLTKMMTLYMVFEALREGRLALNSPVPFSAEASSRPPSKLGIPPGQSITVEQAILALVTRSANDVAAAVGERLSGSEERFAQAMTQRARQLGMTRTTFRNASGLPDPDQVTTARDMATLGRRLQHDFPERYHYFGVQQVRLAGAMIRNHNRMLDSYEGVDGIKTGFINASGFNIVTSASRGGQRVVGAVFGGSSWVERDQHMASLLDGAFNGLGVAVAARPAPVLVRQAQAAPARQARATPVRQARAAPPARQARAAAPARQVTVARQSTGRRPAVVSRSAAAASRPAAPASSRAAVAASSRGAAAPARRDATPPRAAARAGTARPPVPRTATVRTPAPTQRATASALAPRPTGSAKAPVPLPAPQPRGPIRTAGLE